MSKVYTAAKTNSGKATKGTPRPVETIPDDPTGLRDLFENKIRCLYWVENHLVNALPKMVAGAGATELQDAFSQHLTITLGHVTRLEQVFDLLGKPVQAKKSDALEGLTMDGEHIIEETDTGSTARDLGLTMAGQLVENYEITAYTGMIQLATQLGYSEIAKLLSQTLKEEQAASAILEDLSQQ